MTIQDYFDNYKKRKTLPVLQTGNNKSIKEFYENCIKKTMISKDNVLAWHRMLMEYIERKDAIFMLRRYENGQKINGRWNTRRSAITRFDDGFAYVFVSNYEAHEIYNMAYMGVEPDAEEFAELLNKFKYPMHYDNGESRKCEEIDISAYPKIGSVRAGVLNESKYYLAHIYSVNGMDYYWNDQNNNAVTVISKDEINRIAPRGEIKDWKTTVDVSQGKKVCVREFSNRLTDMQKAYVKAHFLRLVDPLNYFLTPAKSTINGIDWKKNIGEYPELVEYVSKKHDRIFGKKIMDEYRELTMVRKNEIGKITIDISYENKTQKSNQGKSYEARGKESVRKESVGKTSSKKHSSHVPLILEPQDVDLFKTELLRKRKATIEWTFSDGRVIRKDWNASRFTENSDVLNNIKSRTWWRERDSCGVTKVRVYF